jgi:hypothetical protein
MQRLAQHLVLPFLVQLAIYDGRDVIWWVWEHEHDRIFLEYFVDVKRILLKYSLTHGKNIHDVEEYFTTCTWMNDNYGWNIIMD